MLLGSGILELALGMIVFYFLLSTLCSTVVELISGVLNWRSQELIKGIRDFLDLPIAAGSTEMRSLVQAIDPTAATTSTPTDSPTSASSTSPSAQSATASPQRSDNLGERILAHSMVSGLASRPGRFRRYALRLKKDLPTYIPPRTFSLALMDILANPHEHESVTASSSNDEHLQQMRAGLQTVSPQLRQALQPLIGGAAQTLEQAQQNIETWFNAKMDRVSGAYKRRVQWWVFVIGMVTVFAINADSIMVATALWQTPTLRTAIGNQVEALSSQTSSDSTSQTSSDLNERATADFKAVQAALQNVLVFPLRWGTTCVTSTTTSSAALNCTPALTDVRAWLQKIVGLLATTLAVALGAPFWFDLLRRVSNLRSSGPAPDEPASSLTPGT